MGDPIVRSATVADILSCANRDGWHGMTEAMAREQVARGPAYAFECDGQVVGVTGMFLQWSGVGLAWMGLTHQVNGHGLWLTKTVQRLLDDTQAEHHLHRVEAVALAASLRNQLWLESLGFIREQDGIARAYTAMQADMVRYERIVKGG